MIARLPLEPLLDVAGEPTASGFAKAVGTSRKQVERAREAGVTWVEADRWACRVGLHPAAVWGDLWWELPIKRNGRGR